jgi:glycosyltransferase involved in cell wall biosynthesis
MMAATANRRLVAGPRTRRPDLLIHGLAQLPDEVVLDVYARPSQRSAFELLAAAYGLRDRVRFIDEATQVGDPDSDVPDTMAELIEAWSLPDDSPSSCRDGDDIALNGHRVAIVTNLPAPYRIPLFEKLAVRLSRAGAALRIFFLAQGSQRRSWMNNGARVGFDREFLSGVELPMGVRRPRVPINLERRLATFQPSVLLCAGFSPAVSHRAARYARRHGVIFGLWSGEHSSMATAQGRLRQKLRRRLATSADFGIAYGFRASAYLHELAPQLPVVYGRNTSEVGSLAREVPVFTDSVRLLIVSDLSTSRKGVEVIVDALRLVPDLSCRLAVVGGGRLLPQLRERAADDRRVNFLGPLPATAVTDLYREADVFLFPSRADVFGLVLVEAMSAGLAVVSSTAPGAVPDIAVDGRNCLLVPDHHPESWARAIERVVSNPTLRADLGDHAERTIASRWTIDHACDAMVAGFRMGVFAQGSSG